MLLYAIYMPFVHPSSEVDYQLAAFNFVVDPFTLVKYLTRLFAK